MITNLLQIAAYKALALQLMLGEADQLAQALKLPVPCPIETQHIANAFISLPHFGVGGSIQTTNVAVTFSVGQLHTITRIDIYPPLNMTADILAQIPPNSAISHEGAYQLATQWLHAIDVDVALLEKRFRPKISQQSYYAGESSLPGASSRTPKHRETVRKTVTIFEIAWDDGKRKGFEFPPVRVTILGNTGELMKLRLTDRSFLHRPTIVMTNMVEWDIRTVLSPNAHGEALTNHPAAPGPYAFPHWNPIGKVPEAQLPDWMAKFFGGEAAVQTLTQPERVNVYRLKKYNPVLEKRGEMNSVLKNFKTAAEYPVGNGPYPVKLQAAKQLGAIIVDAFSYNWRWRRHHEDPQYLINGVRYGLRVEFIRQTNVVDVVFASDNSALIFYGPAHRTPEMSFEPQKKQVSDLLKQMAR